MHIINLQAPELILPNFMDVKTEFLQTMKLSTFPPSSLFLSGLTVVLVVFTLLQWKCLAATVELGEADAGLWLQRDVRPSPRGRQGSPLYHKLGVKCSKYEPVGTYPVQTGRLWSTTSVHCFQTGAWQGVGNPWRRDSVPLCFLPFLPRQIHPTTSWLSNEATENAVESLFDNWDYSF